MFSWIEAQPTPVIGLILFSFCYGLAALAFAFAACMSRLPAGEELKTISPVTLTPLAVILGLLVAFIAGRIWENVAQANDHVGREASALAAVVLLSNALPQPLQGEMRAGVKAQVDFIEAKDWPAMASVRTQPPSGELRKALMTLLSFKASDQSQESARVKAIDAVERAYQARENRIRLSKSQISPMQWGVIVVLGTLILFTTAMIHIGRPAAMAVTLTFFATALGASLLLLMAFDRPFSSGGVSVTPAIFREIAIE